MINYDKFLKKARTRAVLTNQQVRIPVMEKVYIDDGKLIGMTKTGERFLLKDYEKEV